MFKIHKDVRRLTNEEKKQYIDCGYVKNLPVFSPDAAKDLHYFFEELSSRLPSEIDINKTNMWHKASKKFFNLCREYQEEIPPQKMAEILRDYADRLDG